MIPPFETKKTLILADEDITHGETVTANWDVKDGDYAVIDVALGSEPNTNNASNPTISILHSDDTVATNFATIVANQSLVDITNEKLLSYYIDLRGKKRILRFSASIASGNTNSNFNIGSVVGTLTRLKVGPSSTTQMVANTSEQVAVVVG